MTATNEITDMEEWNLLFPSRSALVWSLRNLQWNLWAYRYIFEVFPVYIGHFPGFAALETRSSLRFVFPNDKDANFCQAFETATKPVKPAEQQERDTVDEKAIHERFQSFKSSVDRKLYQRQKWALI